MAAELSSTHTDQFGAPRTATWNWTVLILLISVFAYFQTWADLWPYWENKNATYTHGTLIAAVAVWLVWRVRSLANSIDSSPSSAALPVLLLLSAGWMLAARGNLFIIHAALWPILAFAALWAALGWNAAARFAFPLSFLYFAIPVWEILKPPLQAITTFIVGLLAKILGVPAAFDGPYVTLPTGTILIAEDCSGAHFLSVALAVGVLAGALRRDDWRNRLLILGLAGLLSMMFNWIRVLLIVLAYLHPDLRNALETMGHLTFGWWVFALDLIVFGWVLRFVPRSEQAPTPTLPVSRTQSGKPIGRSGTWAAVVILILLPTIGWFLPRFDSFPATLADTGAVVVLPQAVTLSPDLVWSPHYPGAVWEIRSAARAAGGNVIEVYQNQYHHQSQGAELISRGSQLFDPEYFSPTSSIIVDLIDSEGSPIRAHRKVFSDSAGTSWLALHTYVVGSQTVASDRRAQFLTALRSIYSRTPAGIVATATPCQGDCEQYVSDVQRTFIQVVEGYKSAQQQILDDRDVSLSSNESGL